MGGPEGEMNRAEFPTVDPREGLHQHLPAISCSWVSRDVQSNARTLHVWGSMQMEKVSLHFGSSLDL